MPIEAKHRDMYARGLRFLGRYMQEKLRRRIASVDIKVIHPPRPGKKCLVLDIDYTLFDLVRTLWPASPCDHRPRVSASRDCMDCQVTLSSKPSNLSLHTLAGLCGGAAGGAGAAAPARVPCGLLRAL